MTEQLHFHFSFLCIGEGNGNPLQCSCLENPRDGGLMDSVGEGEGGKIWENGIETCIISYMKRVASPGSMHKKKKKKKDSDTSITPAAEAAHVSAHLVSPESPQPKQLCHLHAQHSLGQARKLEATKTTVGPLIRDSHWH